MAQDIAVLFANVKGNLGDFALLEAVLRDARRRFPGCGIHVYTHGLHAPDEVRLGAFRRNCEIEFEIGGATADPPRTPKALNRIMGTLGLLPELQAHLTRSVASRSAPLARSLTNHAAVLLVGGAQWNSMPVGASMFGALRAVHNASIPVFAYPFSVGSAMARLNRIDTLRRDFGAITQPMIARDSWTKQALDSVGISSRLGVDSAFSLAPLTSQIAPSGNVSRERVLFAITQPGASALPSVVDRLRATGRNLGLLTTCEREDGSWAAPMAQRLGIPYIAPRTWQEAVGEIRASSLLVSNRLHGLIFGCLSGIPILPVINRRKVRYFANDVGLPSSLAELSDPSIGVIEACLSDPSAILSRVEAYMEKACIEDWSPLALAASAAKQP